MTRGRKVVPALPAPSVEVNADAVRAGLQAADTTALLDQAINRAAPLFLATGRMQMADFMKRVSDVALVKSYQDARGAFNEIKDLALIGPDGQAKRVSSFDEYCRMAFGKGERRIQQIQASINTLGEDLYESAQLIGFSARDYQALQALPADDQEAVKVALASGDKDSAIEVLAQRLTRVKAEAAVLAETVADKDAYIAKRDEAITKLRTRLKWRPSEDSLAKTAEEQALIDGVAQQTNVLHVEMRAWGNLVAALTESQSQALRTRAHEAVRFVAHLLAEVIDQHGIEVSLAEEIEMMPAWLRDSALPKGDAAGHAGGDDDGLKG